MTTRVSQRQDAVNSDRPSRTPAGDAFSELVVQVFQLDGLLAATGDALARPTGHTSARWRVLAAVEDAPSTVSHIARLWGLARQSVQRVAEPLVRGGGGGDAKKPCPRGALLL